MAACNLFGYVKNDLMNRKINMLMPNLISRHHDTFVENFVNGQNEANPLGKEKVVYAKTKTGYMLVSNLKIRIFSSNLQGVLLIGQFRQDKNMKQTCWVLVNNKGTIDSISPGAYNMLGIEAKFINKKQIPVTDFIPQLKDDKESCMQKGGAMVEVHIQDNQNELSSDEEG